MTINRRHPPTVPDCSRLPWNAARTGVKECLDWARNFFSSIPGGFGGVIGTTPKKIIVADHPEDTDAGTVEAGWLAANAQLVAVADTPSGLANAAVKGISENVSAGDHQHKRDVRVKYNGADVATLNALDFRDTAGAVTVAADVPNDEVDITINVTNIDQWTKHHFMSGAGD